MVENKSGEIQGDADRNDMKGFYSGLKVCGPLTKRHAHLKSSHGGETLLDSRSVMAR